MFGSVQQVRQREKRGPRAKRVVNTDPELVEAIALPDNEISSARQTTCPEGALQSRGRVLDFVFSHIPVDKRCLETLYPARKLVLNEPEVLPSNRVGCAVVGDDI